MGTFQCFHLKTVDELSFLRRFLTPTVYYNTLVLCHMLSCNQIVIFKKTVTKSPNLITSPVKSVIYWLDLKLSILREIGFIKHRLWRSYSFFVWGVFLFLKFIHSFPKYLLVNYNVSSTTLALKMGGRIEAGWVVSSGGVQSSCRELVCSRIWGDSGHFSGRAPLSRSVFLWSSSLSSGIHFLKFFFLLLF